MSFQSGKCDKKKHSWSWHKFLQVPPIYKKSVHDSVDKIDLTEIRCVRFRSFVSSDNFIHEN